jgi:hypothetical protein
MDGKKTVEKKMKKKMMKMKMMMMLEHQTRHGPLSHSEDDGSRQQAKNDPASVRNTGRHIELDN